MPGRSGTFVRGVGIDYKRLLQVLYLVPHDRMFTKMVASGLDSRVGVWVREFLVGWTQRVRLGGQSKLRCRARERFGPTTFSSVRK